MSPFSVLSHALDAGSIIKFFRNRLGDIPMGSESPTPLKARLLNIGSNDEAIALHALLAALVDEDKVSKEAADALLDILNNHLSLRECTAFQKVLGTDEQTRDIVEEKTEKKANGKDVKVKKTTSVVMNHRGLEIVRNLCKLALKDKDQAIVLMKRMGATRTGGDMLSQYGSEMKRFLQDNEQGIRDILERLQGTPEEQMAAKNQQKKSRQNFLVFFVVVIFAVAILFSLLIIGK